jgi:hypothetical protein
MMYLCSKENKHMKRIVVLMILVLGMSTFLSAGDKSKGTDMTGTICDQKCVKQDAGKSSCDLTCTEQSGEAVFLDDQGKAWKVANPAICQGKMGKKVKAKCKMTKDTDTIEILKIYG